jgi:hypothetical protein
VYPYEIRFGEIVLIEFHGLLLERLPVYMVDHHIIILSFDEFDLINRYQVDGIAFRTTTLFTGGEFSGCF